MTSVPQPDPTPNDLSDERIAHLVRLCARGFGRSLQMRLAAHGVSFGQWVFLRILWDEEGLSQRELADRAGLTEPTVHTALLRLEKLGYVARRTLEGNRRKQHTYLTEAGQALRDVLEPLAVEVNERAMEGLDEAARDQFRDALILVLDNLARDEAAARASGMTIPPTRSGF
ncbi:MarR family winged helix-turn-helix transcriptional regulator [Pseudaestuariivita sp.]|uniref:MarR family winged helix-turn-helix transcriptional regulator n=1 Tax=Pseudaestuariivita sp. TaxID=2211669 RepID=UPI004059DFC9